MSTPTTILPADNASMEKAADLLWSGKLVAFPTETVYGLGGDASQDHAVASIYAAKGRPQFNPLIVHVAEASALDAYILWNDTARRLAETFWPGPLTMVLPRRKDAAVSLLVSAGLDSLAVRVPSHPVAHDLLCRVGRPIAAPSANASGKLSPTAAQHVVESLGGKVDLIIDGGSCAVGVESTVIDLTTSTPTILRPGGITQESIEAVIRPVSRASEGHAIASPGMLASHYAPQLPVRLNAITVFNDEALLGFGDMSGISGGKTRLNLSPEADLTVAAANLFAMLRRLDAPEHSGIAVMPIPQTGLGVAINDRLARAAVRS